MPEISPDVNGLLDSMDNVEVIAATPNLDPRLAQPRIAQQSGQLSGDATPRVVQPLQHAQSGLPSGGATPHVVQFPQRTDARQERDNATYPEYAEDGNQDFIDVSGDTAENDALPMDGLQVLAPARRHPELHPQRTDGLFDLAVFNSHGQYTTIEIGERRSLFPMAMAGHLAKHAVFVCPLPACQTFCKSDTILDVYEHLDDDEHGLELYTKNDMARCPANYGYTAINAHDLSMYHMPKCPSINTDQLDLAYLFDCTHCDATALPLLAFADHWDHAHAVAELHSSTIACEICGKGFGDSALLLAIHCGHFGVQHDCMSSKHFRILDQIDMLWEPPGIRILQDIESSRQLSLPTLKLHHADIRFCLDVFTDMTDIGILSSSQSNTGHSMRQLTTNAMTANEPKLLHWVSYPTTNPFGNYYKLHHHMIWPFHGQGCIVLEATIPDPLRYCYMTEADMTRGQSTIRGRESRRIAISDLANDSGVGLSLQGAPEDIW